MAGVVLVGLIFLVMNNPFDYIPDGACEVAFRELSGGWRLLS